MFPLKVLSSGRRSVRGKIMPFLAFFLGKTSDSFSVVLPVLVLCYENRYKDIWTSVEEGQTQVRDNIPIDVTRVKLYKNQISSLRDGDF